MYHENFIKSIKDYAENYTIYRYIFNLPLEEINELQNEVRKENPDYEKDGVIGAKRRQMEVEYVKEKITQKDVALQFALKAKEEIDARLFPDIKIFLDNLPATEKKEYANHTQKKYSAYEELEEAEKEDLEIKNVATEIQEIDDDALKIKKEINNKFEINRYISGYLDFIEENNAEEPNQDWESLKSKITKTYPEYASQNRAGQKKIETQYIKIKLADQDTSNPIVQNLKNEYEAEINDLFQLTLDNIMNHPEDKKNFQNKVESKFPDYRTLLNDSIKKRKKDDILVAMRELEIRYLKEKINDLDKISILSKQLAKEIEGKYAQYIKLFIKELDEQSSQEFQDKISQENPEYSKNGGRYMDKEEREDVENKYLTTEIKKIKKIDLIIFAAIEDIEKNSFSSLKKINYRLQAYYEKIGQNLAEKYPNKKQIINEFVINYKNRNLSNQIAEYLNEKKNIAETSGLNFDKEKYEDINISKDISGKYNNTENVYSPKIVNFLKSKFEAELTKAIA
jgi:hypothetical protein